MSKAKKPASGFLGEELKKTLKKLLKSILKNSVSSKKEMSYFKLILATGEEFVPETPLKKLKKRYGTPVKLH